MENPYKQVVLGPCVVQRGDVVRRFVSTKHRDHLPINWLLPTFRRKRWDKILHTPLPVQRDPVLTVWRWAPVSHKGTCVIFQKLSLIM